MTRSSVQIPIDDFVTGDLPACCIASGADASTVVEFENDRNVVRGWWLFFLFLGPVGVLVIMGLYALSPRPTPVRGLLPMTREAYEGRNRAAWRMRRSYGLAAVATLVVIVGIAAFQRFVGDIGSLALVALVVLLFLWILAIPLMELTNRRRNQISVTAMAGGRWVEVRGVDPRFVRLVEQQNRARHAARSGVDAPDR